MGSQKACYFGIDIGVRKIKSTIFYKDSSEIIQQEFDPSNPYMPEATTIALWHLIQSLDPYQFSLFIDIGLEANVDSKGRIVLGSPALPDWVDIPFDDWLEVLLCRKVYLSSYKSCNLYGKCSTIDSSKEKDVAFNAAQLALERFKN